MTLQDAKLMAPILITGAARSRTSMTAGIIHAAGAWGGPMAPANANNKKGMFENRSIVDQIIKPILKMIDADDMGQNPLPNMEKVKNLALDNDFVDMIRDKWINIIQRQGRPTASTWMYKGAKMCLLWPLINALFPNAKWVIVRREDEGIVRSCLRTPFMRKCEGETGWQQWLQYHKARFDEMRAFSALPASKMQVGYIWTDNIVAGELNYLKALIKDYLELSWDEKSIREFVDPTLTELLSRQEACG